MKISNPPESSALMATARSFGNYDLSAALADLIDNSIKAHSTTIDIEFLLGESDVAVFIRDNGDGMDGETLVQAMKPASSHPEEERREDDLGRFGWGMKSASLSQARVMTVVSWTAEGTSAASWDIDDIEDWGMEYLEGSAAIELLGSKPGTPSGTEVQWQKTDRLLQDLGESDFQDALTHLIAQARESLSLVFHRYIAGDGGSKLTIRINGSELPKVDPFLKSNPATQSMDPEKIEMANGATIYLQPYVLPHFSKLTSEAQRTLGGAEGMVRNQGFYVYRNRRLIIHGTWFKLIPHRDLSQLTRVLVDLPNSVDHDWRITLDKAGAQLPSELKKRLREIVKKFNRKSYAVHKKKGVSLNHKDRSPVWNRTLKSGQVRYSINRDHPMVESLLVQSAEIGEEFDVQAVFTLLESYFPTDSFLKDASTSEINQTITSDEDFEELVMKCVITYIQTHPGPHKLEDFLVYMKPIEPFASHWVFAEEFVRNNASTILE
jgi:hypothetical protein